jgi:formylglycine-generating enzyme
MSDPTQSKTMDCPDCGEMVSKRAVSCPHCGAPVIIGEAQDSQPEIQKVEKETFNTLGMKFIEIPAGTFIMGSPETEQNRKPEEHQHKVTITNSFYMQTTVVTQSQWRSVMGTEPWKGEPYVNKFEVREGTNYPATYISWQNAVAYCKKLSEAEGNTYRLPTEAEWEYACRAGTTTTWCFGDIEEPFTTPQRRSVRQFVDYIRTKVRAIGWIDDPLSENRNACVQSISDYAWHYYNAEYIGQDYAHEVGRKMPNAFSLYDMHGNVDEWCSDYYRSDYYKQSPEINPTGPAADDRDFPHRVQRGGYFKWFASGTRSAARKGHVESHHGYSSAGFRLVKEKNISSVEWALRDEGG